VKEADGQDGAWGETGGLGDELAQGKVCVCGCALIDRVNVALEEEGDGRK
jgi:hypothetical protein